jgi:hypothetical protein
VLCLALLRSPLIAHSSACKSKERLSHGGIFLLKVSCLLLLPVNRFAKSLVGAVRATEILRGTSPLRFRSVFPLKKASKYDANAKQEQGK